MTRSQQAFTANLIAEKRKRIQQRIERYRTNLRVAPDHDCADLWRQFIREDQKELLTLATQSK